MTKILQDATQQAEAPAVQPTDETKPFHINDTVLGPIALSRTANGEVLATVDLGHRFETLRVNSELFRKFLVRKYYMAKNKILTKKELNEMIREFSWRGRFDGKKTSIYNRYAIIDNTVYVDLCDRSGHFVRIDAEGWSIQRHDIDSPTFLRQPSMKEQVKPEEGGSILDLAGFLNLKNEDEEQFVLIAAYILGAMYPHGPFPILTVHGPQGSSKSTMLRIIRSLVDPSEAPLTSEPSSERDLFISANHTWMQCIDNVSTVSSKMSDAYCRLATEGVFRTRKLYTSTDETIIKVKRPVAFNGIGPFARQNDFLDRSIWVYLPSIPASSRRPESEFWEAWEKARPGILGSFFSAVSTALRNLKQVETKSLPRMADFARWVIAAEPACPWEPGTFMNVYEANRAEMVDIALESDFIGEAVLKLMRSRKQWQGTSSKLLNALKKVAPNDIQKHKDWPKAPNALSNRLMRLEGFLAGKDVGITRERLPDKRLIILTKANGKARSAQAVNEAARPSDGSDVETEQIAPEKEQDAASAEPREQDIEPANINESTIELAFQMVDTGNEDDAMVSEGEAF